MLFELWDDLALLAQECVIKTKLLFDNFAQAFSPKRIMNAETASDCIFDNFILFAKDTKEASLLVAQFVSNFDQHKQSMIFNSTPVVVLLDNGDLYL
ncbi:hypothetical protein AXFE_26350 [Acidithrix ferrooxidans]|uniref:Uncharacterized protein n=1 Tax=Acidithrix ferrooxidans TaxID=1280514 RepID=A0A0D8HET6_9ACTN|nr:hypothetical protein AXFE_26350 [Acidithrix ferrooxidans]